MLERLQPRRQDADVAARLTDRNFNYVIVVGWRML